MSFDVYHITRLRKVHDAHPTLPIRQPDNLVRLFLRVKGVKGGLAARRRAPELKKSASPPKT